MKLTKEQYEALTPYAQNLKSAYKNSFVRMSGADFMKVVPIYTEVFGKSLTKSQMSCNTCRLNTLRKLGELYLNYEEKAAEKEEKKKETIKKTAKPKKTDGQKGQA